MTGASRPARGELDGSRGPDADQMVAALYREHYGSLARIAALLLGDDALAEELVQDAYASVHRAWTYLRDENEALAYLRQTVVGRARALGTARPGLPAPPRLPGPAGTGLPPGLAGISLLAALRELPALQREALVLKYYADWPDAQIAVAMGISASTLDAHVWRGMSALRARAYPRRPGRA